MDSTSPTTSNSPELSAAQQRAETVKSIIKMSKSLTKVVDELKRDHAKHPSPRNVKAMLLIKDSLEGIYANLRQTRPELFAQLQAKKKAATRIK